MKRLAYSELLEWKNKSGRKPLIIRGARQVGKTWLMNEFGKNEYDKVIYINFEDKKQLQSLFKDDFNIERILLALEIEAGIKAEKETCLIIFDEIQEAERGVTSLKYFNEEASQYHVIAAGSYLGIAMQKESSFPVGKVDFLKLDPLSFNEFLLANKQEKLYNLIAKCDWDMITTFKTKYIELLKQYYYVGGMPEVVSSFIEKKDFKEVRKLQKDILHAYRNDFAKHAPITIVPRINMVWDSIPAQLAKENKKFIFGVVKKGSRAKDYELALEWLIGSGLINKVNRVSKPGIPLKAYSDNSAFKVFFVDIGLLGAISDLDKSSIIEGNKIFEEFKGALTEQFVFQQIKMEALYYWSAESSSGEIDFIIQINNNAIPIEVKAEENLKAKSLQAFNKKYKPEISIRSSMSDFRKEDWMINLPLYVINECTLTKLCH